MGDAEKSDVKVLFPGAEVCGYTTKPWVLRQIVALAPILGSFLEVINGSEIRSVVVRFVEAIDIETNTIDAVVDSFKSEWKNIVYALLDPNLVPGLIPLAPRFLSISLDVPEEEVGGLGTGPTADLVKAVLLQNRDYIKNYFGPARQETAKAS